MFVTARAISHRQLVEGKGAILVRGTLEAIGVDLVLKAIVGVGKAQVGRVWICNTRREKKQTLLI